MKRSMPSLAALSLGFVPHASAENMPLCSPWPGPVTFESSTQSVPEGKISTVSDSYGFFLGDNTLIALNNGSFTAVVTDPEKLIGDWVNVEAQYSDQRAARMIASLFEGTFRRFSLTRSWPDIEQPDFWKDYFSQEWVLEEFAKFGAIPVAVDFRGAGYAVGVSECHLVQRD